MADESSLFEAFYRLRNSYIVSLAFDDAHTGELFDYSFTFTRPLLSSWRKALAASCPMRVRSISVRNPDYFQTSMRDMFAFFEADLGAIAYVFEGGWYADEPCELDLPQVRNAQDVSIVAGAEYMPQKAILSFAFNTKCKRLALFESDSAYAVGFEFVSYFVKRYLSVPSTRAMVQCCKISCIGQPDPTDALWKHPSQIGVTNAFTYPLLSTDKKPTLVCDIYHFQNRFDKEWMTAMVSRPVRVSQYGWLTFVNIRKGHLELTIDN
ncbi:hypothetical protein AAVH_05591 [Aphelenchoides avenae]|nr:hypothetical protein AAVH_05591 [Aphelenchus avenae]